MTCCLKRIPLLSIFLGAVALLAAPVPAQDKNKKEKKAEVKKEEKKAEEPKKEVVKEKLAVPLLACKGHTYWVNQVVYSGDGKLLASAGRDRTVRVWDAMTAKELKLFKGLPQSVKSVVFFSADQVAGSSGKWEKKKKAWEGEILIWDIKTSQPKSLKGHSDTIESLAATRDSKKLASGSDDQTVLIWDVAAGKVIQILKGHSDAVLNVAFSPDGMKIATASKDKSVKLWDVGSGKDLFTFKLPVPVPEKKTAPETKKDKGKEKTKEVAKDKKDKGKQPQGKDKKGKDQKAKEQPPQDTSREMTSVAFNSSGNHLAAANLNGTIKILEVAGGKEALNIKVEDGIWSVAYSPDGKRLAAGGWEGVIYVFDSANAKLLFRLRAHEQPITSLAYSPDGSRFASASLDQTIKVWDASGKKK